MTMMTKMSMSIITTTIMTTMTKMSMSIITTMIMTMSTRKWSSMKRATGSTDPTTIITIIITTADTTRMRSSSAGAWRHLPGIRRMRSGRSWRSSTTKRNTASFSAPRAWYPTRKAAGSTLFLDSGKSSFFSYTIAQPYFQTSGTTLLIVCEEGEVEYGERLLRQTNTVMEVFENEEDLTPSAMMALEVKYRPERILIEYNGMWNYKNFRLPRAWRLEQQITVIDASTFSVYFTNMRSLLAEQLRGSELIMFNRCDGIDEKTLVSYKRNVKAINQQADLIFEDSNGEIDMTTEEDLPYDIHKEPIVLEDLNYGIWYLDAMEHPDRYDGKEIEYTGMVMVPDKFPKGYFVPGRMAMTCCANDMSFLGYACKSEQGKSFPERTWVRVRARVSYESFSEYDGEGIVLYAESVEETRQPKEPVINFAG